MRKHYDIVIIGAGINGLWLAKTYAEKHPKKTIALFDQYTPPHDLGSSHGESRMSRLANGEGDEITRLGLLAREKWRAFTDQHPGAFQESGVLIVGPESNASSLHSSSKAFVVQTQETAAQHGIEHESLSGSDARAKELFPGCRFKADEKVYYEKLGGILCPDKCIKALVEELKAKDNVTLHFDQHVTYEEQETQVVIKTNGDTRYSADKVALAMGPWARDRLPDTCKIPLKVTRQILFWFQVKPEYQERYKGIPAYVCDLGVDHTGAPKFFYGFPIQGDDEVIKVATEYDTFTTPEDVDRTVSDAEVQAMVDIFAEKLEGIDTSKAVKTKVCLYTMAPHSQFYLGYAPNHKRTFVVVAGSGHAFKHAAGVAAVACARIDGEADEFADYFQLPKPDLQQQPRLRSDGTGAAADTATPGPV